MNKEEKAYLVIAYVSGIFGEKSTKKAIVYDTLKKYKDFFKVVDYPVNKKNLNKRMLWIGGSRKENIEDLSKSGDWCFTKPILVNPKVFK